MDKIKLKVTNQEIKEEQKLFGDNHQIHNFINFLLFYFKIDYSLSLKPAN
jgi:hypothetical protein